MVKKIFCVDENAFWYSLLTPHQSTSAHIRIALSLSREIIKEGLKELGSNRSMQTSLMNFVTGSSFKFIKNGILMTIRCPKCNDSPFIWEHFYKCYKVDILPNSFCRPTKGLVEILCALHENRDTSWPLTWSPYPV